MILNRLRVLGIINALAIGAIAVWGCVTDEWYLSAAGGSPGPLQVARWVLIALNAPAFLISVAALSFLHLGLFSEFVVEHVVWAALSLVIWPLYARLRTPPVGITRAIVVIAGLIAAGAAGWVLTIAWKEGHDPNHSCWDALQAVFMLSGLAVSAFVLAAVRPSVPEPV